MQTFRHHLYRIVAEARHADGLLLSSWRSYVIYTDEFVSDCQKYLYNLTFYEKFLY